MSDYSTPPPPQESPPSNYPRPDLENQYDAKEIGQNLKMLTLFVLLMILSIALILIPGPDLLYYLFIIVRFVSWIAAAIYGGRLANSVGESQPLAIILCLLCFLIGVLIYTLKATKILKQLGYKVTDFGFNIKKM